MSKDQAAKTSLGERTVLRATEAVDLASSRKPTRQELVDRLEWNSGGMGFGVCSFASSMMWTMSRPKEPRGSDDLKSIVAVSGPAEKYSDEELAALVEFSDEQTAKYDETFRWRLGANVICINKFDETSWMRKRLSWDMGQMFSPSLDDALNTFREKPDTESAVSAANTPT